MRAQRFALFAAGFILALLGTLQLILGALDRAQIEPLEIWHGVASYYLAMTEQMQRIGTPPGGVRVAFLGDSKAISYPHGLDVATQLQKSIRMQARGKPPIRVFNLALAGTGSFDYYFVSGLVTDIRPDIVVIHFSLGSIGAAFRDAFSRPELAGFVGADRILETSLLPINWIGLTFGEVLLYSAIVGAGGLVPWGAFAEEQTRVEVARGVIEEELAFENARGKSPEAIHRGRLRFYSIALNNLDGRDRHSEYAARRQMGVALNGAGPDHPALAALGATIRTFGRKGIRTLVYVSPENVDHLESLGILDEAGLAQTLESLGRIVEGNGATFVDLHRLFPDALFRDHGGHYSLEGGVNGPGRVAAKLAPTVIQLARDDVRKNP